MPYDDEIWPRESVGIRIAAARKKRKWTQIQLAKRIEVDQSTVSRLEKGVFEAKPVVILRELARVLEDDLGLEELRDYAQSINSITQSHVFNEAALAQLIRSIVQREVEWALAQQAVKPYSQSPSDILLSEGWPLPANYDVQIENWTVMSRAEQETVLRKKRRELLESGYERRQHSEFARVSR